MTIYMYIISTFQRYLPSVEQVNLSNNQIGLRGLDTESSSNSGSINSVEREDGLATVSGIKVRNRLMDG